MRRARLPAVWIPAAAVCAILFLAAACAVSAPPAEAPVPPAAAPAADLPGEVELVLTTGERLHGALAELSSDTIALAGPSGCLTVPRRAVRSIALMPVAEVLLSSDFEAGKLGDWKGMTTLTTNWKFEGGKLLAPVWGCSIYRSLQTTFTETGPMTVEARMTINALSTIQGFRIAAGKDTIRATLIHDRNQYTYRLTLNFVDTPGGKGTLGPREKQPAEATLRLAYDPAAGKATFWLDSTRLAEIDIATPLPEKRTVWLDMGSGSAVSYVRVLRGVAPPDALVADAADPPAGQMRVEFANRDRVLASQVTLTDGHATLATELGPVKCPLSAIARLVFAPPPVATPPASSALAVALAEDEPEDTDNVFPDPTE